MGLRVIIFLEAFILERMQVISNDRNEKFNNLIGN